MRTHLSTSSSKSLRQDIQTSRRADQGLFQPQFDRSVSKMPSGVFGLNVIGSPPSGTMRTVGIHLLMLSLIVPMSDARPWRA